MTSEHMEYMTVLMMGTRKACYVIPLTYCSIMNDQNIYVYNSEKLKINNPQL